MNAPTTPAPAPTPAPAENFTALGTTISVNDIDQQTAAGAHRNTSHHSEQRGRQERAAYYAHLRAAADRFTALAAEHPEHEARIAELFASYAAGFRTRLLACLHSQARVASPFIVGPAKFPVRRMEKLNYSLDLRRAELHRYMTARLPRLLRVAVPAARNTAQTREDALRARISEREARQAHMKTVNAALRSKALAKEGLTMTDHLAGLGLSRSVAARLQEPDYLGRLGYADYQLTNNGAEIRRLRKQHAAAREATRAAATGPSAYTVNGYEVEEDHDGDRIRVTFHGKPDAATRTLLKGIGLRWAPSLGVWQRQLTNAARYAVQTLLASLPPAEESGQQDKRSTAN